MLITIKAKTVPPPVGQLLGALLAGAKVCLGLLAGVTLWCSCAPAADAPPISRDELVERIAGRYTEARTASAFRATQRREGVSAAGSMRSIMRYEVYRAGRNLRISAQPPGANWTIVLGSDRAWLYDGNLNQFVGGKRGEAPAREVEELAQANYDRLGGRFAGLSALTPHMRIGALTTLAMKDRRISCLIVQIVPPDEAWEEEICVEVETAVVRRSVLKRKATASTMASTQTITWDEVKVNEPVDPNVFEFEPPRGARRVQRLGQRQ